MIQWSKKLIKAFGASFLWLICIIYFTQGFREFVWTAVSYQLKDKLMLSPSASQFVNSVIFIPWTIKPIYGIVSDCIPIKGQKRVPYLIIATILSLVPWLLLGFNTTLRSGALPLTVFLTLQNLGSAVADVVIDAMIAEAIKLERASFAGDLQSVSWFAMAFGGIYGSFLGGYALANLQINTIFLLFTILPAIQLFSCCLVNENVVDSDDFTEHHVAESSLQINGNTNISDENMTSKGTTIRRKKNKSNGIKEQSIAGKPKIVRINDQPFFRLFHSLKKATSSLCCAFRQPIIMRPMAWFFLAHIAVPNLSTVIFYYQSEILSLDASFMGSTHVVGWIGLMVGTYIYNRFLRTVKLRKILWWAQVGLFLASLDDIVLITRMNVAFGIPDKAMILCGSALGDAINQFKFMPFLILSGLLCPPGIEGTLFALFMSINNLGSTLGSLAGAGLASLLQISSGSFDNLLLGVAIQLLCMLIPAAFLFLIPKDATGIST